LKERLKSGGEKNDVKKKSRGRKERGRSAPPFRKKRRAVPEGIQKSKKIISTEEKGGKWLIQSN